MTHAYAWGAAEGHDMAFYCPKCDVSYSLRVMSPGERCIFCKGKVIDANRPAKEEKMACKGKGKKKNGGKK